MSIDSDIPIADVDKPNGRLVIAAAAVVGVALIGGVYLVWIAPGLLAAVALDAALAGGLYERLRRIERQHWLRTVLQRTAIPFLVTAVALAGVGFVIQRAAPGVASISEAFQARRLKPSSDTCGRRTLQRGSPSSHFDGHDSETHAVPRAGVSQCGQRVRAGFGVVVLEKARTRAFGNEDAIQ